MNSELIKRIFTSIVLLIFTFSILIYLNKDFFGYFLIIVGIFCFAEWINTNFNIVKKTIHILNFI